MCYQPDLKPHSLRIGKICSPNLYQISSKISSKNQVKTSDDFTPFLRSASICI